MIAATALLLAPEAAAQGPRSGGTVVAFFAAVDAGAIDAALALVAAEISVTAPDGTTATGKDGVRPLLEAFPRPIEIRDRRPIGRGQYEAWITAGAERLYLRFRGVQGLIAEIAIERDAPPVFS